MENINFLITEDYELSVWGEEQKFDSTNNIGYLIDIVEYPIATIGGNKMNSPARARDVTLKENINGSHILTFTMCAKYANLDSYPKVFNLSSEEIEENTAYITGYGDKISVYEENPFIQYLKNESKIKLKYKEKWYDFLIKDIQEDSDKQLYKYTAKDLFINELSRTGYSIELNTELGNNMGTAQDLGEIALASSDWQVDKSTVIKQYVEEPLYIGVTNRVTKWKNLEGSFDDDKNNPAIEFASGTKIYIFYSCCINQSDFLQCIKLNEGETQPKVDNNNIIVNGTQYSYYIKNRDGTFLKPTYTNNIPDITNGINLFDSNGNIYRGKRLVRSQAQLYDPLEEQMVKKCEIYDQYGVLQNRGFLYSKSEFQKDLIPINKIGCNENFRSLSSDIDSENNSDNITYKLNANSVFGWNINNTGYYIEDNCLVLKHINGLAVNNSILPFSPNLVHEGDYFYLSFLLNNKIDADWINTFKKGIILYSKSYIYSKATNMTTEKVEPLCTFKPEYYYYYYTNTGNYNKLSYEGIDIVENNITVEQGIPIQSIDTNYSSYLEENEVKYSILLVGKVREDLTSDYIKDHEFYLSIPTESSVGQEAYDLKIKKIELFKRSSVWKQSPETGHWLKEIIFPSINPDTIKTRQELYEIPLQKNIIYKYNSSNKREELYNAPEYWFTHNLRNELRPVYDNTFAKVSYLDIKESNRFNIIQSICEKFECWATFNIEHDTNGYIKKEKAYILANANGDIKYYKDRPSSDALEVQRQVKTVKFVETPVPKKNSLGFKYGVNLKQITRTVNSDQLSTFVIVKNNNNEFATNGFCSIARASENYSKENSIINFDYYIQMGLLDRNMLYKDLYVNNPADGHIGYYYALRRLNNLIDAENQKILTQNTDLESRKALLDTTTLEYSSQVTLYNDLIERYYSRYGDTDDSKLTYTILNGSTYPKITEKISSTSILIKLIDDIKEAYGKINTLKLKVERLSKAYIEKKDIYNQSLSAVDELIKQKALIINKFRSKYSRFIQEGTWSDDSYIDDNKYYLDALKVANTSSKPQISYNISVVDIAPIMDTDEYSFEVGQVTTMEDPNFFGYDSDGLPYKEEVIISEITYHLDSPDKNEIVVQNYRTQWEDLFQRISATVQNLQYVEGSYAKAAGILTSDGNIKVEVLQSVIDNNSVTLQNATNESVVWDDKGITVTSKTNAANILRLVSNGVYVSQDGGSTYINAIRGDGISASVLTAGVVNTQAIVICNGEAPSFHWDEFGISAYQFESVEGGATKAYDLSTFVRFDRFGVYGIKERSVDWVPTKTSDIVNEAHFSLTWNGFNLKTGNEEGIRINETDGLILYKYIYDNKENHIKLDGDYWAYERNAVLGSFSTIFYDEEDYTEKEKEKTQTLYGFRGYKNSIVQLIDYKDSKYGIEQTETSESNTEQTETSESNTEQTETSESNTEQTETSESGIINILTLSSNSQGDRIVYLDFLGNKQITQSGSMNLTQVRNGIPYNTFSLCPNGLMNVNQIITGLDFGKDAAVRDTTSEFGYSHIGRGSRVCIGSTYMENSGEALILAEIGVGKFNSTNMVSIMQEKNGDPTYVKATNMYNYEKIISLGGNNSGQNIVDKFYIFFGYKEGREDSHQNPGKTKQVGYIQFNNNNYTFKNIKYTLNDSGEEPLEEYSSLNTKSVNCYLPESDTHMYMSSLQGKNLTILHKENTTVDYYFFGKDTTTKTIKTEQITIDKRAKIMSFESNGSKKIGCFILNNNE